MTTSSMLAIDAGNSRIKWGFWRDGVWAGHGTVASAEAGTLSEAWRSAGIGPIRVVASNVAGTAVAAAIERAAAAGGMALQWFRTGVQRGGVTNRYDDPAVLGTDRWAALIGARARCPAACVVVNCGTAITIDALTVDGEFVGGLILPGLNLMRESLSRGTAQLADIAGEFTLFPRNTADAMASGAVYAAAGAVSGLARRLFERDGALPHVVLSGGGAPALAPQIEGDVDYVPHLVLEGLVVAVTTDGVLP